MQISAPTNFDFNIIKKLKNIVHDTYGSLNNDYRESIVPWYALRRISIEKLKEYIEYSHALNIKFNYIMNHPNLILDKSRIDFLGRLHKINVDMVTVSNPTVIIFIKKNYPFEICGSILCGIDSLERAIEYKNIGCDILTLSHNKNNNIEFIKLIKKETKAKIKLLANNFTLFKCPYGKEYFKDSDFLEKCPLKCLKLKLNDISLMRKTGFIHPGNIKRYEEAVVDFLKIGGRTKPTWWIINCVIAYYKKNYKGNCFRLMNTMGSENRYPPIVKSFLIFFPNIFIRYSLKFLFFLTNKKIYEILSKEKDIKSLLKLYFLKDSLYIDDEKILIDEKEKEYLLKTIDSVLE